MSSKRKKTFATNVKWQRIAFFFFFIIPLCMGLASCGEDDDNASGFYSSDGGYAPDELSIPSTFTWDEHFNIISGPDAGKSSGDSNQKLLIYNETNCRASWSFDYGTYRYSKTGKNTSHLSFSIARNVVGHVQSWQYNLDLTFTAKGNFTMTGSKVILSNMTGTTRCEIYEGEGVLESGDHF